MWNYMIHKHVDAYKHISILENAGNIAIAIICCSNDAVSRLFPALSLPQYVCQLCTCEPAENCCVYARGLNESILFCMTLVPGKGLDRANRKLGNFLIKQLTRIRGVLSIVMYSSLVKEGDGT